MRHCDTVHGRRERESTMRNRLLAIGAIVILLYSCNMFSKPITIVIYDNDELFEFKDKDGKAAGYIVDYIKEAGKEAGFSPEFVLTNARKGIEPGQKFDAISMLSSGYRDYRDCIKTDYVFQDKNVLITAPNSTITKPEELKNKKVAWNINECLWAIQKVFRAKPVEFSNDKESLNALLSGNVDALVFTKVQLGKMLKEDPDLKSKINIITTFNNDDKPYHRYYLQIVDNRTEAIDLISKGILSVKQKGVDTALSVKWFGI